MTAPWYQEWAAPLGLRSHLVCSWAGQVCAAGVGYVDRVLPDGCVDVVWDGYGLLVAGPDTGPVPLGLTPGASFAGVRFAIGAAPIFLRLAASDIRDQRVPLAAVWGDGAARAIAVRLEAADTPAAAARLLEAAVLERVNGLPSLDPAVAGLVAALQYRSAPATVGRLATELGTTVRSLHRACTAAVGYGPKTLDRVLRFRRFLALSQLFPGPSLAGLAVTAGYADQAHLTRECSRLAGATPTQLLAERRRRNVQDSAPATLAR